MPTANEDLGALLCRHYVIRDDMAAIYVEARNRLSTLHTRQLSASPSPGVLEFRRRSAKPPQIWDCRRLKKSREYWRHREADTAVWHPIVVPPAGMILWEEAAVGKG